MGQRQKTGPTEVRKYKYTSVVECEENEDAHVFSPNMWPPKKMVNQMEEPALAGRCDLCGCHLMVYAGHATGELRGIRVNLSGLNAKAS